MGELWPLEICEVFLLVSAGCGRTKICENSCERRSATAENALWPDEGVLQEVNVDDKFFGIGLLFRGQVHGRYSRQVMLTALDTNFLLDILVPNHDFAPTAESAIETAASDGLLVVCDMVMRKSACSLRRKRNAICFSPTA